ncbi:hypothetical protein ISS85_04065 [Candidatus Microgenomates bacterium]|nr:hypothetical protein [Candidatus Microgenomates bacterium]
MSKKPTFVQKKLFYSLAFSLFFLFPLFLSLKNIIQGNIPFWFDNARDFLLALGNLEKPTLIGPPTGIPGVFYGPYWIWLLSISLIFSKDPRFATILVSIIPYFTLFPYLLWKLSKLLKNNSYLLIWPLFIFNYESYVTFLWNPHPAPLIFLMLIYLTITVFSQKKNKALKMMLVGLTAGFLTNFHMSFGIGTTGTIFLYFIINAFISLKGVVNVKRAFLKACFDLGALMLGVFVAFLPFFIFEIRHGFNQIKAIGHTIIMSTLYNSAVVGQIGLKKPEIIYQFFKPLNQVFKMPKHFSYFIVLTIIVFVYYQLKKQNISFIKIEKKLLCLLFLFTFGIFCLFLSSKNPVWTYHFIGFEMIVLILIALIASKFKYLKFGLLCWSIILVLSNFVKIIESPITNPLTLSSLSTKKHITEKIYQDANQDSFAVFTYSSAIYTYDYDYLFTWLGEDKYSCQPEKEQSEAKFIYLIIPQTKKAILQDFINYKTPNKNYETVKEWKIPDGTIIVKRKQI